MVTGTRTTNLPTTTLADTLLVNRSGSTRQQALADFIAQIGGSAALQELLAPNARALKGGIADAFSDHRFDLIGGTLRQRTDDLTKYYFLDDGVHAPLGFDSDQNMVQPDGSPLYPRAAGINLAAWFKRTTDVRRLISGSDAGGYDRIISLIAGADDDTSRVWGLSVGAKVLRTGIQIHGSVHRSRSGRIYWDGSTFATVHDALHPTGNVTVTWDNTNTLTVTHDWLPGQDLTLEVDTRGGGVATPFIPVRHSVNTNGTEFKVQFLTDGATGPGFGLRTGAVGGVPPGSGMSFRWTRSYDGPMYWDGTSGFDNIDLSVNGNIWVLGVMQYD